MMLSIEELVKQINRHFLIRVDHELKGAGSLVGILGERVCHDLFLSAMNSTKQVFVKKFRGSYKVQFVSR